MDEREAKYIVLGGGIAGGAAIFELIDAGVPGKDILLLAAEKEVPYDRPPLSKSYLAGKKDRAELFFKPEEFYTDQGIVRLHGTKVTALDPTQRVVTDDTGRRIHFEKLLIATGGRPRHLSLPGSDLTNSFVLRTIQDSDAIQAAAKEAKEVVVIGAGFIGLEVAATLTGLGCHVTVLHRGTQALDRFASPEMAKFFTDFFRAHGVALEFEKTTTSLEGKDGHVTAVTTEDGQKFPADLVVAGIGVELAIDWLSGSGLAIDNGILLNEYLETSRPGVFAAGDVANFPDQVFGGARRRIEHWDHARETGKAAARNMLGKQELYHHLSYFFSDMFDLSFELWGDTTNPDQVIFHGDMGAPSAVAWYIRDQKLAAYLAAGRPDKEKEAAQKQIEDQTPIDITSLTP